VQDRGVTGNGAPYYRPERKQGARTGCIFGILGFGAKGVSRLGPKSWNPYIRDSLTFGKRWTPSVISGQERLLRRHAWPTLTPLYWAPEKTGHLWHRERLFHLQGKTPGALGATGYGDNAQRFGPQPFHTGGRGQFLQEATTLPLGLGQLWENSHLLRRAEVHTFGPAGKHSDLFLDNRVWKAAKIRT